MKPKPKLPVAMLAVLEQILSLIQNDTVLGEIGGIAAIAPPLPRSTAWLNRCAIARREKQTVPYSCKKLKYGAKYTCWDWPPGVRWKLK